MTKIHLTLAQLHRINELTTHWGGPGHEITLEHAVGGIIIRNPTQHVVVAIDYAGNEHYLPTEHYG